MDVLQRTGFVDVAIVRHFECFRGTSKELIANKYGVRGVNVVGRKP